LIKTLLQQKQPSEHEQAMSKLRVVLTALIMAVLFVSAIAGTIFYYNGVVDQKNSEIASLNAQLQQEKNDIANLTSQISSLNQEIANLTTANLVNELIVKEVADGYDNVLGGYVPNHLVISGSVKNVNGGTAYNAGLQVLAFATNGSMEVNVTVPLANGVYGTDSSTKNFVGIHIGVFNQTLGSLAGNKTVYINEIDIYHQSTVTNWTVTPVWTNSP
jgi:cell division protein FtsB